MITEALQKLTNTLGQVQDRRRKLQVEDTMMLLGTKFVGDIQQATDTTTLSSAMLNANKMAFALGVPELASQVNNLGHIKMQEIVQGKSEKLDTQKAIVMKSILKDQKVLIGDEYTTLGTTQEFKQIEALEPALQADAYKILADNHKTQIVSAIDTSGGMNKAMLKRYAVGPNGEQKLVQEIKPTENGFMSYLTGNTSGVPVVEPAELVEYKSKLQEYQWKKKEERDEFLFRQSVQEHESDKPKLQQVQFSNGTVGYALWNPKSQKFTSVQSKEDITDQVIGKGYKQTKEDQIKRGDIVGARQDKRNAAWMLINSLVNEGKISADDINKFDLSGNNKPDPIAVLQGLQTGEQPLQKWAKESKTINENLQLYWAEKEHFDKVNQMKEDQENKILNKQSSSNQSGGTIALPKLSFGQ